MSDLQTVQYKLGRLKVDQLKACIKLVNSRLPFYLKLAGNKPDLLDRLVKLADKLAVDKDTATLTRLLDIIREVETTPATVAQPRFPAAAAASTSTFTGPSLAQQHAEARYNATHGAGAASGSGAYGAPVRPLASTMLNPAPVAQPAPVASGGPSMHPSIRFKTSPFYRVDRAMCPFTYLQLAGQHDRRSAFVNFTLREPERQLLLASRDNPNTSPKYEMRVYCTTENAYIIANRSPDLNMSAPMEFPPSCEIRLNGTLVPGNTKGIKKQAGTAPPLDLGRAETTGPGGIKRKVINLTPSESLKVEILYTNTEKRYCMVVYLVETTSPAQLVETIKKGKYKSAEAVVAEIVATNQDPEIEATTFGLSLRDPLTMMRIATPIRSTTCKHLSCFDASTFMTMNEQTPTWSCPCCNKPIKMEDLVMDGYVESIIAAVPSSTESVNVEPNGLWRSLDDKYGTAPSRRASKAPGAEDSSEEDSKPLARPHGKGKNVHAIESDSDDDGSDVDSGLGRMSKKQKKFAFMTVGSSPVASGSRSPGGAGAGPKSPVRKRAAEVIDLTLDSD